MGAYEGVIGVAWPSMSETFLVSLGELGVLLLVGLAGFILVSFSSGWLIRQHSIYWLLQASAISRAVGFAGMALSPVWAGAIVSVFFISAGAGGIDTGLNGFVSSRYSIRQLNWMHANIGLGATLGPFLVAAIFALNGSWRWSFAVLAIFQGLTALLIGLTSAAWQVQIPLDKEQLQEPEARLGSTLRLRVVWLSLLLFFLYTGLELTTGQWSFTLFNLGRGVPALVASTWVGIYWGSFTIGRILFGVIVERFPTKQFLRLAILAVVAGTGLLWWNPATWVGFLGLAISGFALAPIFPTLIASTLSRVGRSHTSNTIGFQIAAAGIGGAGLTGLAGVLGTSFGLEVIAFSVFMLAVLMFANYEILQLATRRRILK